MSSSSPASASSAGTPTPATTSTTPASSAASPSRPPRPTPAGPRIASPLRPRLQPLLPSARHPRPAPATHRRPAPPGKRLVRRKKRQIRLRQEEAGGMAARSRSKTPEDMTGGQFDEISAPFRRWARGSLVPLLLLLCRLRLRRHSSGRLLRLRHHRRPWRADRVFGTTVASTSATLTPRFLSQTPAPMTNSAPATTSSTRILPTPATFPPGLTPRSPSPALRSLPVRSSERSGRLQP